MLQKVFMDYVNKDNYIDVNLNFSIDNFLKIISFLTPIQSLSKICLLNKENRKLVFEDDKIKEILKIGLLMQSGTNQWHYYREILSKISVSEFLSLYDASFLREYFLNSNGEYEYTFFAALAEKNINEVIDFIINDNDLFNDFFDQSDYFCASFCYLNYNSVKKVILKMKDINRKFDYSFINSLTFDNQCEIINDSEIDDETLILLIRCMCKKAQNYFFENDHRALYMFLKFDTLSLIKRGIKFNDIIVIKDSFFERLKSLSLIDFRNNINNVQKYNNPIIIDEKVEKYYDDILNSYMSEYFLFDEYKKLLDDPSRAFIFGKYYSYLFDTEIVDFLVAYFKTDENGKYYITDKNKVYDYLKDKTNKKISEVVIDALFKDNIYNVWINIKEMLRFNSRLEDSEKVLSKEKIDFYNLILNFDSVSCDDKIKIYNKLKNGNFSLTFYEDLTSVKDVCYNKIKDNLVNISLYSEKYDVEKSKKHGVKVYDFRDKKYTMLVRTMAPYYEESHYRRNCYSIISNENNAIFGERDSFSFLYGYSSFDNDHVLHMLEKDAYSLNGRDTASRYVNRIMTTSELVMSNLSYNEIQLVNKKSDNKNNRYIVKKPDYLVVFDVVTDRYIQESKRLNIPIVIISKSRVNDNYKSSIVLDEDYDAYVNNIYSEMEHRVRR